MTTIKDASAALAVPGKDELVAALEAAGHTDSKLLRLYNSNLYTAGDVDQTSMVALLKECNAQAAVVKHNEPKWRTCLTALLDHLHPVAPAAPQESNAPPAPKETQPERERKEAETLSQTRYTAIGTMFMFNVRAQDRLEPKLIKKLHDGFTNGHLPVECYALKLLKRAQTTESEKTSCIGGLTVAVRGCPCKHTPRAPTPNRTAPAAPDTAHDPLPCR